ncbi:hypothetical protein [Stutzerimonas stutzeri]|uniref:hypothetical protein n=1 Tax=Stutzerimonas stutzeri TaxID=316 RepID=UPI00265D2FE6|nr:hypothetical protein [Stutzerimonas stutzeri]MCF6783941.1 hypothetical protein [Stutzerimonas stutzeri]
MTYLQENIKLALASVLAFVLVIAPLVIGYQVSQFVWGLCFSGAVVLTIKLFYECGKYDGSFEKRCATHTTS